MLAQVNVKIFIQHTVMCCLMRGIHSEKCITMQFCSCVNIIDCPYTNLDGVGYYTPSLNGTNLRRPLSYMRFVTDQDLIYATHHCTVIERIQKTFVKLNPNHQCTILFLSCHCEMVGMKERNATSKKKNFNNSSHTSILSLDFFSFLFT